jgi:hypothetical protein
MLDRCQLYGRSLVDVDILLMNECMMSGFLGGRLIVTQRRRQSKNDRC